MVDYGRHTISEDNLGNEPAFLAGFIYYSDITVLDDGVLLPIVPTITASSSEQR